MQQLRIHLCTKFPFFFEPITRKLSQTIWKHETRDTQESTTVNAELDARDSHQSQSTREQGIIWKVENGTKSKKDTARK